MCSDGWSYPDSAVDGECPECGMDTVNGEAQEGCYWSPLVCGECGYSPCDYSC